MLGRKTRGTFRLKKQIVDVIQTSIDSGGKDSLTKFFNDNEELKKVDGL